MLSLQNGHSRYLSPVRGGRKARMMTPIQPRKIP
jgi:hypothetical protein